MITRMLPSRILVMSLLSVALLSSCAKKAEQTPSTDSAATKPVAEVKIVSAETGVEFPGARLEIVSPKEGQVLKNEKDSQMVVMKVTGMELGKPTPGDSAKGIAYSKQGQHVHVIVDGKPYMADYKNGTPFNIGVLAVGKHTIRAFPARSWHESVKAMTTFGVRTFYVGAAPAKTEKVDAINSKAPMLTYSRPKGTYTLKEAEKLLLDFYLTNATLGADGDKVSVTIDGKMIESLTEWKPYFITGLGVGKHTIALQLIDAKGAPVPGEYNAPSMEITISN
ncbi:MAG: hypothetical protein ABI444_06175 [Candidatus Kapaibacterium sp.]|jgi:hypothetical protein